MAYYLEIQETAWKQEDKQYISTAKGHVVVQLVKHPTLDLGSGLDLTVVSWRAVLGSTRGVEPT